MAMLITHDRETLRGKIIRGRGGEEVAETAIDRAVRLGRKPLLLQIAALKEELAAREEELRKAIPACGVCAFRESAICRRCADNPKNKDGKDKKDNKDGKETTERRIADKILEFLSRDVDPRSERDCAQLLRDGEEILRELRARRGGRSGKDDKDGKAA